MYKVMLVDDDVPMLEYIGQMLDWSRIGLSVAGTAFSSELALERFHEIMPDLVITDIGLPVMNGIELAQAFRELKPDIRIIFLTCYEDTVYLKKAFQLAADDYLIKDELTEEKLLEAVNKSLKWFRDKEETLEWIAYRRDIERNKDVLRQQFFEQVIKGRNGRETLMFGERLGIRWSGEQLFTMLLVHMDMAAIAEIYELEDYTLLSYAVYNVAEELAAPDGHITPFLYRDELVLVCHDRADLRSGSGRLEAFVKQLADKTQQFLKIRLMHVEINEWVGLGSMGGLHKKLQSRKRDAYYGGTSRDASPGSGAFVRLPGQEEFRKDRSLAAKAFEDGNPVFLDLALDSIRQKAGRLQLEPRSVVDACEELIRHLAGEFQFHPSPALFAALQRTIRLDETMGVLKTEGRKLLKLTLPPEEIRQQQDASLSSINRFIDEHICETVTSIDVANHLRLNSSYFSRLFKKKTGVNFTEYVHQYKMKMAKRLLDNPEETVENVAYTLGYSDRAYFSKVFKKYVGTPPSDYKHSK